MNKIDTKSLVFSWLGKPTPVEIVPLSLQHVAAMVVGCVTPAIIVSNICGLSPADSVILIQSALIISGLATLVQLFPIFGKVGSGLPVIMGASFAYLPTL
ncbi:solute carrier family 23 protein, partial [Eubacterium aggregans]